jgi:hypothetical protein
MEWQGTERIPGRVQGQLIVPVQSLVTKPNARSGNNIVYTALNVLTSSVRNFVPPAKKLKLLKPEFKIVSLWTVATVFRANKLGLQ